MVFYNFWFMNSLQIHDRDPFIVQIPQHRRSVAHLPEALKDVTHILLPDGQDLKLQRTFSNALIGSDLKGVNWNFDEGVCKMCSAFSDDLPPWIKIGPPSAWIDAEKGIPTIQACKAILVNALNLKGNVKKICLESVNIQTQIDINLCLLKGSSLQEAAVKSKSAYLAAELGEMLGGKVRLTNVEIMVTKTVTKETLFQSLKTSTINLRQQGEYLLQKKFIELQNLLKPGVQYNFARYVWMEFAFIPDLSSEAATT